jgi:hypothetical protein
MSQRNKRRLTVEQVSQIRQQSDSGRPKAQIAKQFGISRQHVWYIVTGWRWKKSS